MFGLILKKKIGKFFSVMSSEIQSAIGGRPLTPYEKELGQIGAGVFSASKNSPIQEYLYYNLIYSGGTGHFHRHYPEWRYRRLMKILNIFEPEYFSGKKILEIGSGLGFIGSFLAELGADVTSLEGRKSNRTFSKLKYAHIPTFNPVLCDLETDFTHFGKFDLIINFGILEVIENIDHVMECCNKMSDNMLLETMVCDSEDPEKIIAKDMLNLKPPIDSSINKYVLTYPSPFYIEKFFESRNWKFERHFASDLNTYHHCYDWKHGNPDPRVNLRRFWHFTR